MKDASFKRWSSILTKINKRVDKKVGKNNVVHYSAFKEENGLPVDNLDDIAILGKAILVANEDDFFGGKNSKNYQSPVLENPTWLDLCVYADQAIKTTNDFHHVFLESVHKTTKKTKGVYHYEFLMGS